MSNLAVNKFAGLKKSHIWISYGRRYSERQQLGYPTFMDFMRLEILVYRGGVDFWLRVGKSYGSTSLRQRLKRLMAEDQSFAQNAHEHLMRLEDGFQIEINGEEPKPVHELSNVDDFIQYVQRDNLKNYFYIGKRLKHSSSRLSEDRFPQTSNELMEQLYPLFLLFLEPLPDRNIPE